MSDIQVQCAAKPYSEKFQFQNVGLQRLFKSLRETMPVVRFLLRAINAGINADEPKVVDDIEDFFDAWSNGAKGKSLQSTRRALLGGPGFAAPPSFLVSSTKDEASPPKEHTDLYARALQKKRVKHCTYLRRNFGPHGFGMSGGWTDKCVAWLHARGFGRTTDS
eukprot:s390_g24.t1